MRAATSRRWDSTKCFQQAGMASKIPSRLRKKKSPASTTSFTLRMYSGKGTRVDGRRLTRSWEIRHSLPLTLFSAYEMKAQQIKYLVTNKESISSNESNIYRIGHHNKVPLIDHSNMQTKAIEERAVVAFVGFRHIFIVRLAHL